MNMRIVMSAAAGLLSVVVFTAVAAIFQSGNFGDISTADLATRLTANTLLAASDADGTVGDGDFFPTPAPAGRPQRPVAEQTSDVVNEGFVEDADDPFAQEEPGVIDGLAPGGGVLDGDLANEELRLYRNLIDANLRQGREAIRQINRQKRVKYCNAPNVVVIDVDDLGYGDLGAYGQKSIETTHIDQLAYQGVRFTDYYAGTSLGIPSRCSFMTGKHTGHSFLRLNEPGAIPSEEITLAEVMWQAGYDTALFGAWNLGAPDTTGAPYRQGFENSYGFLTGDDIQDYYPEFLWNRNEKDTLEGDRLQRFAHEIFIRQAEDFITRRRQRPFFMYVSLPLLHGTLPEAPTTEPYREKDWPEREKQYAAMLTLIDEGVGRIRERLNREGLSNNSLIILTSSNGPRDDISPPQTFNSTRGLRGARGSLYEGGIRVPMIVWGPGHIKRPHTSNHVWAAWDLIPTLADLVDARWRPQGDGISIEKLLKSEKYIAADELPQHDYLYWEVHKEDTLAQAMRMKNWKAVRNSLTGEVQIFNLAEDPAEEHNVAAEHPDIVRQFDAMLTATRVPMPGERFAQ